MIIGIDEVGRGAWAGPLVVGAVGLGGAEIEGLTDSKLLTKKKREKLSLEIKQTAPLVGIGWVSARDIDTIGLSAALKLAARRAVSQLDLAYVDQIIIDGTVNLLQEDSLRTISGSQPEITLMKKADMLVPSVSAASVIAKVARDHYMVLCDRVFPGYGFAGHVGYGAEKHRLAIRQHGVLPIHRASFAPIAESIVSDNNHINSHMQENVYNSALNVTKKDTSRIGRFAEEAAAQYLASHSYTVVKRNWKTKWCEVDIIATRRDVVYFVEVKYRKNLRQGGGVAAITPKKLAQMRFAAKLWLHNHPEVDARLSVIEVTGEELEVTRFEENVG